MISTGGRTTGRTESHAPGVLNVPFLAHKVEQMLPFLLACASAALTEYPLLPSSRLANL
jgi:hypothetical protein